AADPDRGLGGRIALGEDAIGAIAHAADGDARRALGILETAAAIAGQGGRLESRAQVARRRRQARGGRKWAEGARGGAKTRRAAASRRGAKAGPCTDLPVPSPRASRSKPCARRWAAGHCSTTATVRSTTTSPRHY